MVLQGCKQKSEFYKSLGPCSVTKQNHFSHYSSLEEAKKKKKQNALQQNSLMIETAVLFSST